MFTTQLRPLFETQQQGPIKNSFIFEHPVASTYEPDISEDDRQNINSIQTAMSKKQHLLIGIEANSRKNRLTLVSTLSRKTKQKLCAIDCTAIVKDRSENTDNRLSRLLAEAEGHDWILMFDEADALFSETQQITDDEQYLVNRLADFTGIAILSSTKGTTPSWVSRRIAYQFHLP